VKARRKFSRSSKRLRWRGEQLPPKTPYEIAAMPADEVQKLVQELGVQRSELERQNAELRRTRREWKAGRDRYAELYDFAPVALLTLNAQGEILEANLHAAELLGLARSRLLHQKFTRFVAAEAQDAWHLLCRQIFGADARQRAELPLVTDQAKRLVVQVEAVRDKTNSRQQGRFSFTDITGRKQAEAEASESRDLTQAVMSSLTAHIAALDQKGNIVAVNESWNRFAQENGAPSLHRTGAGVNYLEVCRRAVAAGEPGAAEVLAGIQAVLQRSRTFYDAEYPCHSQDKERWFIMTVTPLASGGGVVVTHTDITEHKRAAEALHESERLLRTVMDLVPHFIFVKDSQSRILLVNRACAVANGLTPEQMIGRCDLDFVPDRAQAEAFMRDDREVIASGKPKIIAEERLPTAAGQIRILQTTKIPFKIPGAGKLAVLGVAVDITELKQAGERITQLNRAKAILGGVDHAIVHLSDRQRLLDEVCRVAVERGGFKLAWIGVVSPEGSVQPVAKAGATRYLKDIRVVTRDEPEGRGIVGTAIRENRPVVIEDAGRDARMAPWQNRLRQFGLHYVAAFPIRIAGQVAGSFQVYAPRAGFFDEEELRLLTQVSDDISFALTALSDLAARLQAEKALRRSEHHLTNFFNHAPIGLLWLSASGTILRANQAQLDLLGCAAGECVGRFFNAFCAEPASAAGLLARLATKETVRNLRLTLRCQPDERQVLVDANSFWSGKQFQYSSLFVRDISDRLKLEREVLHVGEREHRRIAQDLHDGLGQLLVGAAYMTSTLQKDLAVQARPEAGELDRIAKVLYEAIAQARCMSQGLHPVEPEPNGLMAALESLACRTQAMFRIGCRFTCQRPVLISDNGIATHLYRIAQEAITNAVKHGKPGRIEISLTEMSERIHLAVRDNGTGLPTRPRKKTGMGLRIMRHRAGMIGGSLAIQKEAGGGTAVVCSVHLPEPAAAQPGPAPARKKE